LRFTAEPKRTGALGATAIATVQHCSRRQQWPADPDPTRTYRPPRRPSAATARPPPPKFRRAGANGRSRKISAATRNGSCGPKEVPSASRFAECDRGFTRWVHGNWPQRCLVWCAVSFRPPRMTEDLPRLHRNTGTSTSEPSRRASSQCMPGQLNNTREISNERYLFCVHAVFIAALVGHLDHRTAA
jgi:hypothetical protein